MARPVAAIIGAAVALAAWSAGAEPALPGLKPALAATPLPAAKPAPIEAPGPDVLARIAFAPLQSELSAAGAGSLEAVARQLRSEPGARIQIIAFAEAGSQTMSARRVSLERALAVRSYLMERGVGGERMIVRALESPAGEAAERVDLLWPPR